jgi:hypothetical protein
MPVCVVSDHPYCYEFWDYVFRQQGFFPCSDRLIIVFVAAMLDAAKEKDPVQLWRRKL